MSYIRNALLFLSAYTWYLAAGIAIIFVALFFLSGEDGNGEILAGNRVVEVVAVADYARGARGVAVPTANGNAFVIRSEAAGKVTRTVETSRVTEGAFIAELENSSQRAALLQAEGAYEVALASSGGNETSQQSARQDGVRVWTAATVAVAKTIRTSIDDYFAEIRGTQGTSGFKLEAFGTAEQFNADRDSIESNILDRWESEGVDESNAALKLAQLNTDLATIGAFIDRMAALVPRQKITTAYSESDRSADATTLAAARAAISTQEENVDAARTAIQNASGSGDASAQAQVKQALGALEAARANYEKTIVRAPFAGTLTSLNVIVGDIISVGSDIAIIVPENGVETTRSFALPLSSVKYTPAGAFVFVVGTNSSLESRPVITGLVTAEAINVTGLNGDETIVKDVRGLKVGQTVEVAN